MPVKLYILVLAISFAILSCDRSTDDTYQPGAGTEVAITTTFNEWVYFSFTKGDTVGTGAANAATDSLWRERTDWDLAFLINNVRTNSGASGIGIGGAYDAGTANFQAVEGAKIEGYTVDAKDSIMYNMLPMLGPVYGTFPVNETFVWTTIVGNDFELNPKVFVVKTADGKHAKVFIKKMETNSLNRFSRILTMEYFYQPDGSRYLNTVPDATASAL